MLLKLKIRDKKSAISIFQAKCADMKNKLNSLTKADTKG